MSSTIELSDLERGIEREFPITPSFLSFVLSREIAGDQQTLGECMRVAADFTAVTSREMAMTIYSELPKDPNGYHHRSRFLLVDKLAVPNMGDMHSVENPTLSNVIYGHVLQRKESGSDISRNVVYVPIVHLHTHPSGNRGTFPSKTDLENAMYRYEAPLSVAGVNLRIKNPELQVINTNEGLAFTGNLPVDSQLFYQFTGNHPAFNQFMDRYKTLFAENYPAAPEKFAQAMQSSGAFKTLYFKPGELTEHFDAVGESGLGIRITKKNETKLAKKFQYTLKIFRP